VKVGVGQGFDVPRRQLTDPGDLASSTVVIMMLIQTLWRGNQPRSFLEFVLSLHRAPMKLDNASFRPLWASWHDR
jgi:hypothetical protein